MAVLVFWFLVFWFSAKKTTGLGFFWFLTFGQQINRYRRRFLNRLIFVDVRRSSSSFEFYCEPYSVFMSSVIELEQTIGKDPLWKHFDVVKVTGSDETTSFKLLCKLCNSWAKTYLSDMAPLDKAKRHLKDCRCGPNKPSSVKDHILNIETSYLILCSSASLSSVSSCLPLGVTILCASRGMLLSSPRYTTRLSR